MLNFNFLRFSGRSFARCDDKIEPDVSKLPDLPEVEKPELVKQAEALAMGPEETIKAPPPFELISMDHKRLSTLDSWDGVRFEVSKPVTPTFGVNHMFWLGTSAVPGGVHYTYGATVAEDNNRLVMGRVDIHGNVEGRVHFGLRNNLGGKILMTMGQQESLSADLTYTGESCCCTGKVAVGPSLSLSYIQALTSRIAFGGEGLFDLSMKKLAVTGLARYTTPQSVFLGTLVPEKDFGMNLYYLRKVIPNRLTLGAELSTKMATMDSEVTLCAEFQLKQSRYVCTVAGNGRIANVLETRITPNIMLSFSGEVLHSKDQYKFGYGLTIGN